MLIATMGLEDRRGGTFSYIPRLTVNRVLPGDALVFDLVRNGRLAEFQKLLWDGEVSLRDHDERGNSLLAVSAGPCLPRKSSTNKGFKIATNYAQPEMCQFLLSHNADVDVYYFEEDQTMDRRSPLLCTAGGVYGNESEEEEGYPPEVFECRKLLLDAGADPTDYTEYASSGFLEACDQSTLVGLHGWGCWGISLVFGRRLTLVATGNH